MAVKIPKIREDYFRSNFIVLNAMGVILKDVENPNLYVLSRIYMVTMIFVFYYLYVALEVTDLIKNLSNLDHTAFEIAYLATHILGSCLTCRKTLFLRFYYVRRLG